MKTQTNPLQKISRPLLALAVIAAAAGVFVRTPAAGWLPGLVLVLAVASTLVSQCRSLQLQNIAVVAAMILCLSGGILLLGAKTEIPFGAIVFTDNCGDLLFAALPPAAPLLWLVIILNCRGVARLILRPWRKVRSYGFRVIGLTVLLAVVFDFALEPFAVRLHRYWLWPGAQAGGWFGAPWVNFFGWAVTVLFILIVATPWLINKMPGSRPPDYHPLILWLALNLFLAVNLAANSLWPPAAVSLSACVVAVLFVRWR